MKWMLFLLCMGAGGEVDERLRAAEQLEKSHQIGQAIQARERYLREVPDSPAVMLQLARNYEQIASFSEALRHYRAMAQRFAGERDAPAALARAIHIEAALGLFDEERRDRDRFTATYSYKQPAPKAEPRLPAPKLIPHPWFHLDSKNQFLARAMSAYGATDRRTTIAEARRAIAVGEADGWALMAASYDDHPALARLVIETARREGPATLALEIVDGYLYLEANQRPQAQAAFQRALVLEPKNADAQAGLSR